MTRWLDPVGRSLVVPVLAVLATSCASDSADRAPGAHVPESRGGLATTFAYRSLDGAEVSSATTRGRLTVVVFVTTFDLASQVQVRALERVFSAPVRPFHALAVALEPAAHRVLVEAFRSSMKLTYPVAHEVVEGADRGGPFGDIERVPTLVVLDARGVERWRKDGLASPREIEESLAAASRR